jgi:hypothetical protein
MLKWRATDKPAGLQNTCRCADLCNLLLETPRMTSSSLVSLNCIYIRCSYCFLAAAMLQYTACYLLVRARYY